MFDVITARAIGIMPVVFTKNLRKRVFFYSCSYFPSCFTSCGVLIC